MGFNLEAYLHSSLTLKSSSKVLNLVSALERLGDLFKAKRAQIIRRLGEEQIHRALSSLDPKRNHISQALAQALTQRSASAYAEVYREAQRLWQLQPHWQRRQKLLERLREAAPDWARAIEKRRENHGKAQAPKEPEKAWLYRLLTQTNGASSPSKTCR
ncbi:hypothetical protein DV704_05565 [Meiothermus sp. QL-1]|nr:hypothetical protein DV704_05565 [Meiothermus sp. QL-1]